MTMMIACVVSLLAGCGPRVDISTYEHLSAPVIHELPALRVIEVEASAASSAEAAGKAIGLLYQAWYGLDIEHPHGAAPRGRWAEGVEAGDTVSRGVFALPVPQDTSPLEDPPSKDGMTPRLATWEYGETAEILHVGSYAAEAPTIERLKRHITEQGYRITGLHEEEYVKGPGMFFKGNPDGYYTVIRHQVEPLPPSESVPDRGGAQPGAAGSP